LILPLLPDGEIFFRKNLSETQKAVSGWGANLPGRFALIGIEKNLFVRMPARIAKRNVAGGVQEHTPLAFNLSNQQAPWNQPVTPYVDAHPRSRDQASKRRSLSPISARGKLHRDAERTSAKKITRAIAQNDVRDQVGPFPN
jgi:hypothetical protein